MRALCVLNTIPGALSCQFCSLALQLPYSTFTMGVPVEQHFPSMNMCTAASSIRMRALPRVKSRCQLPRTTALMILVQKICASNRG